MDTPRLLSASDAGGRPRRALPFVLLAGLLTATMIAAGGAPGAAAQSAQVVLSPASGTLQAGEVLAVDVVIEDVASLWGGQIALRYDPEVVAVVDADGARADAIEPGGLLEPSQITEFVNAVDHGRGLIEYAATLRNNPRRPVEPASGTGAFARIHFKGVRDGTTVLAFDTEGAIYVHDILFVDGDLASFTMLLVDGALTVEGGAPAGIYLPAAFKDGRPAHAQASGSAPPSALDRTEGAGREVSAAGSSPFEPEMVPLDDPEVVYFTHGRSPYDLVVVGDAYYWRHSPQDLCDEDVPETHHVIMGMAPGRPPGPLWAGCTPYQPGRLAADTEHLYFVNFVDGPEDAIMRIPVEGGAVSLLGTTDFGRTPDPSRPGQGLGAPGELVLDGDYIYFGDWVGIRRMHKSTGAVEDLARGPIALDLAVDGTDVYWIDQDMPHAIRRVAKTGGTPADVWTAAARTMLGDLALDESRVYWTASGAIARSLPKDGSGTPLDYGGPGASQPGDIGVDATHVYWLDDLRLRRAPKAGGRAEALAVDLRGSRGLNVTGGFVAWGGWAPFADVSRYGIWRLPLDAGEILVDIEATGLEITQAIQNLANDVPLVEGKTTYARVFARSDVRTAGVTAALHGSRGGAPLPGSPLAPVAPLTASTDGGDRADLEEGFEFLVPDGWRSGEVTFEAEVNPTGGTGEIGEADRSNNRSAPVTVTFANRDRLCLRMVPVRTEPETFVYGDPRFYNIVDAMAASYPVPDVQRFWDVLPLAAAHGTPFRLELDDGELTDEANRRFGNAILERMALRSLYGGDLPGCAEGSTHYYGMVTPRAFPEAYYGGGMAYLDDHVAYGTMHVDLEWLRNRWADVILRTLGYSIWSVSDWDWFDPPGWATLAEEVGHNLGRQHVDCGGPDHVDPGWPYDQPCYLAPDDPAGYFGFNTLHRAVIPPTTAADFMSYAASEGGHLDLPDGSWVTGGGKPEWVSDYTYRTLFDAVRGAPAMLATADGGAVPDAPAAPAQRDERLVVSGVVAPGAGESALTHVGLVPASLVPAGRLDRFAARVRTGPTAAYTLRLSDASNTTLRELHFDPPVTMDAPGDGRSSFLLVLPYEPGTARLTLSRAGDELAQRDVSAAAPTVQVLQPNGGETVTDRLAIAWQGSDPDGDKLTYTVQYSPDGAHWQVLALDTSDTSLEVSAIDRLPGGDAAMVRVIANDGVLTASDTSDAPFSVRRKAPLVEITAPADGATFAPGSQVIATGRADDAEDGRLEADRLQWLVDDAPAGGGAEIAIPDLAPGAHTVTLRAVDSDQMTGEATITIHIQEAPCDEANRVEVVFLVDTSPDMTEQLDDACRAVKQLTDDLRATGRDVRAETLGISQARACAGASVRDRLKKSAVNHPADWGAAVRDIAAGYAWSGDAVRLVVPVSNGGPEDGDPVADPGPDRDIVEAAIVAARRAHVAVAPLVMPPADGGQVPGDPAMLRLAKDLAAATGGRVLRFETFSGAELSRLVPAASCAPVLDGLSPSCGADEGATFTLHGRNLVAGSRVTVGDRPSVTATPDTEGTRLTFTLPAGLRLGGTYAVRVEHPSTGSSTLPGALTHGPCTDRCADFLPGDIALPMWLLRGEPAEITFEAHASAEKLTVRLYAENGPAKLLVQEADGTGIASVVVLAGATGELTVPPAPGKTYRVLVRNAGAAALRFRLFAHGAEWLRTADDGDDWAGGARPGRGEDHGAMSHPELGFAGRWSALGPDFATTTWFFDVAPGTAELAVAIWSEGIAGSGHAGMAWVRPDGSEQPLVGAEGPGFDHTWRVRDPAPGFWGLRLSAGRTDDAPAGGASATHAEPEAKGPIRAYLLLPSATQGYSLARLGQADDDWLYFRPGSTVGPPCGPSVIVLPPAADACQGGLLRTDILVADVANLYGAEVHLSFDNARLTAVDAGGAETNVVEPGTFLDPALGLIGANAADNDFGLIDYAVSLKHPAAAAFGDGVLATVFFRAEAAGTAEVTVDEVKLSERPDPPAPAARVAADHRGTTFEVADCTGGGQRETPGTLGGQVWLDGRLNYGGATVSANPGAHSALTPPDGGFTLTGLPPGDYALDLRHGGYLRAGPRSFTVAAGEAQSVPNVTLLGGDCNASDGIDIVDGAISASFFGLSGGWAADMHPDIDADGVVDIYDLVMIGNNFGCAVDDPTPRCRRWERP